MNGPMLTPRGVTMVISAAMSTALDMGLRAAGYHARGDQADVSGYGEPIEAWSPGTERIILIRVGIIYGDVTDIQSRGPLRRNPFEQRDD